MRAGGMFEHRSAACAVRRGAGLTSSVPHRHGIERAPARLVADAQAATWPLVAPWALHTLAQQLRRTDPATAGSFHLRLARLQTENLPTTTRIWLRFSRTPPRCCLATIGSRC